MNRQIWKTALAIVAIGGVGAAAQSTSAPPHSGSSPDAITVVGCLQYGARTSSSTGTSGSTNATSAPSFYTLTNATTGWSGTASSATAGSAPRSTDSPTTSTSSAMGSNYIFIGHDSELNDNIGHRIEVTGTLDHWPARLDCDRNNRHQ